MSQKTASPNGTHLLQGNRRQIIISAVRATTFHPVPERGGLLPEGFRNPFLRSGRRSSTPHDLAGEPDITVAMAEEFLQACDGFQLQLFAPMVLYGLRAGEPCLLFAEHVRDGWLKVPCIEALAYLTKGRR